MHMHVRCSGVQKSQTLSMEHGFPGNERGGQVCQDETLQSLFLVEEGNGDR